MLHVQNIRHLRVKDWRLTFSLGPFVTFFIQNFDLAFADDWHFSYNFNWKKSQCSIIFRLLTIALRFLLEISEHFLKYFIICKTTHILISKVLAPFYVIYSTEKKNCKAQYAGKITVLGNNYILELFFKI